MSKDPKESRDILRVIDDLRRELRLKMRGIKESVKFCSDTCDGVHSLISEVKDIRKELLEVTKANTELRTENRKLTQKVEELQHYQRSNNLEIKGVPERKDVK